VDLKDFQTGALRTESPGLAYQTRMEDTRLVRHVFELLSRIRTAGEQANLAKRGLYYGKPYHFDATGPADVPDHIAKAVLHTQYMRMLHAILGKASELAELVEILDWMGCIGNGQLKPMPAGEATADTLRYTARHVGEEFGDDAWYNAVLADAAEFDPDEALARVLAKLKARYPDKFTEEAAGTRDLDAEARALVGGAACT